VALDNHFRNVLSCTSECYFADACAHAQTHTHTEIHTYKL